MEPEAEKACECSNKNVHSRWTMVQALAAVSLARERVFATTELLDAIFFELPAPNPLPIISLPIDDSPTSSYKKQPEPSA